MNKIKIVNDNLEQVNVGKNIQIEYYHKECLFSINEIKINVVKTCNLEIEIDLKQESKLNINLNISNNSHLNLTVLTKGQTGKIQYEYSLGKNSTCDVLKFHALKSIKEMIKVNLNGLNSCFNYNFKSIATSKETYDFYIFHNSKNTNSNIKNNSVCISSGNIIYQVSSFVPKDVTGCIVNQSNRIINLTNNKCEIKPNLYIDCNDVEASHSALIGKFSDDELFYLQSRGIDYNSALNLLIKGFLTSDVLNKKVLNNINKKIDKYWR